jgi:hypothetical protein
MYYFNPVGNLAGQLYTMGTCANTSNGNGPVSIVFFESRTMMGEYLPFNVQVSIFPLCNLTSASLTPAGIVFAVAPEFNMTLWVGKVLAIACGHNGTDATKRLGNGPADDLNLFVTTLKNTKGYQDSDFNTLGALGADVSYSAIKDTITLWKQGRTVNDHLILFFSGHGSNTCTNPATGLVESCIVPDNDVFFFASDFMATVFGPDSSTGPQITVFLDACHSGQMAALNARAYYGPLGNWQFTNTGGTRVARNALWAACDVSQTTIELENTPNFQGVFTQQLCAAITSAPSTITNGNLLRNLDRNVNALALAGQGLPLVDYTKGTTWQNAPFLSLLPA